MPSAVLLNELAPLTRWSGGLPCEGGALAVAAVDRWTQTPGGVSLQVVNVGSLEVLGATLIVRALADTAAAGDTLSISLPPLLPGEVIRVAQRITLFGELVASFESLDVSDASAAAETSERTNSGSSELDAQADASLDAAAAFDAAATEPVNETSAPLDTSADTTAFDRCALTQQPFVFNSVMIVPVN